MNPLTEARTHVATALADLDITTHAMVPTTITAPCAWITAGTEWGRPITLAATTVDLIVTLAVKLTKADNEAIVTDLEEQVWAATTALRNANVRVGTIAPPTPQNDNRNIATVDIDVTVVVTD